MLFYIYIKYIYKYILKLNYFAAHLKLTQYSKSVIPQFKKNKNRVPYPI